MRIPEGRAIRPKVGRILVIAGLLATMMAGAATAPIALAQDADPSLAIVNPAGGEVITANEVEITVEVENYTIDCAQSGLPDADGVGHIHAMVDGMTMAQLANFYCDTTFTVPLDGLEPGPHTVIVDLASNMHLDMADTAQMLEIDYQPENPVAAQADGDATAPAPTLVSPADGDTVPAIFTVELDPGTFVVSEGFMGRTNMPGFGHWHVWVDTTDPMAAMEEAMMGMDHDMMASPAAKDGEMMMAAMPMPNMVLMTGSNTFELDLSAWGPGEHTIFIGPAQNDHTGLMEFEPLIFTVVVEES